MVPRKLLALVIALIIPGGIIALGVAWLLRLLSRTERGRRAFDYARERTPHWAMQPLRVLHLGQTA